MTSHRTAIAHNSPLPSARAASSAPPRPAGWATPAAPHLDAGTGRPPMVPLALLAVTTVVSLALLPWARPESLAASEVSTLNVVGWVSGTWIALALFFWFRSVNQARSIRVDYAIPRWRPALVAMWLALGAVGGAFGHAWMIADAVSRR